MSRHMLMRPDLLRHARTRRQRYPRGTLIRIVYGEHDAAEPGDMR
jgi:hypothetical protein